MIVQGKYNHLKNEKKENKLNVGLHTNFIHSTFVAGLFSNHKLYSLDDVDMFIFLVEW